MQTAPNRPRSSASHSASTRGRRDSSQRPGHAPISERRRTSADPASTHGRARRSERASPTARRPRTPPYAAPTGREAAPRTMPFTRGRRDPSQRPGHAPPHGAFTRGRTDSSQRPGHAPIAECHVPPVDSALTYGRARHPGERAPSTARTPCAPTYVAPTGREAADVGAGEGIRTLDVHLGKMIEPGPPRSLACQVRGVT